MMKPTFTGHVSIAMLAIAVKMYKATNDYEGIKLNMIHGSKCRGQLKRGAMICSICNEPVPEDEVAKGYKIDGDFVVITPTDLETIRVPSEKNIEILAFVARDEIATPYYGDPYYLGPDGSVAAKSLALLREMLRRTDKVAVGRFATRGREELVALTPLANGIVIQYIRPHNEVRAIEGVPGVYDAKISDKEMQLGLALAEQFEAEFSEIENEDRYLAQYKQLIQDKLSGKKIKAAPALKAVEQPNDVLKALEASLATGKPKKAAKAAPLTLVSKAKGKKGKAA
jgi:DNA end-binding protein Ku